MIRKKIQVINQLGIHARAAAKFVQLASRYEADIFVTNDNKQVNGKSIMGVMMLAASHQSWVELIVEGHDEENALTELEALINDRFGESA